MYGISLEFYETLLEIQESKCEICGSETPSSRNKRFHVDHDHKSKKEEPIKAVKVRGLLCFKCNWMLGLVEDKPEILEKAVEYLKREGIPMYQKVIIAGNLGQDVAVKYTPSGSAVANFSVAVDDSYKDKSGEFQKKVEWVSVVAWEKLGELAAQYLKKGSGVLIEGKLQTRSWEDKQSGEKKYKTEVIASSLKFLDKKSDKQNTDEETPF